MRKYLLPVLLAFAGLLSLLPLPVYFTHVIILVYLYAFLSTAWNLVGGYTGQLSLGHAAFFGLAAYTSTLLFVHYWLSPWIGLLIGVAAATGGAALIGYPCFRFGIKGPYFTLATIAFAEILLDLFTTFREVTGGSLGVFPLYLGTSPFYFQFEEKRIFCTLIFILWIFTLYLTRKMQKMRYRLIAIREDEDAAAALGVPVTKYKLVVTMLSGALTGIGGVVYAQYFLYLNPYVAFGLDQSLEIALPAIFGGMFTLMGPTIGAAVLIPISEYLRITLGGTYTGVHLIVYGSLLMICMILMPKGIIGEVEKHFAKKKSSG